MNTCELQKRNLVSWKSRFLLVSLFILFLQPVLLLGQPPEENIILFLNAESMGGVHLSFRIDAISLLDSEGKDYPLGILEKKVSSARGDGFQVRIASGKVPEKGYSHLKIKLTKPLLSKPKKASLLWEEKAITLPVSVAPLKGRSETIFIDWDIAASIHNNIEFKPVLSLSKPKAIVRSLKIFATDEDLGEVLVIDRNIDKVVSVIKVGEKPKRLVLSPDGERVYVANSGSNTVSVIDARSDRVIDTIPVEYASKPVDVVVTPDGDELYVANTVSHSVSVFRARSSAFLKNIEVGRAPEHIAASADGRIIYVSCKLSDEIYIIDTERKEVAAKIKVSSKPIQMAVQPRKDNLYVAHEASQDIIVIQNRARAKTINPGFQTSGLNFDRNGSRLFLLDHDGGRVIFFDPSIESMLKFVKLKNPVNVIADPDGKKIYVAGGETGQLYIVDKIVGKVLGVSKVGGNLFDLAVMR